MLWAFNEQNERLLAAPGTTAKCDYCGDTLIAKCGEIKIWHWAHHSNMDCDSWAKEETQWHKDWKESFPGDWREIQIGCHRADIKTPVGVIELQDSSISVGEIFEREMHYGNMMWIVNGASFFANFEVRPAEGYCTFRWKWPRTCWCAAKHPLYFDFGITDKDMFRVRKLYSETPCGGWGKWVEKTDFMRQVGNVEAQW